MGEFGPKENRGGGLAGAPFGRSDNDRGHDVSGDSVDPTTVLTGYSATPGGRDDRLHSSAPGLHHANQILLSA